MPNVGRWITKNDIDRHHYNRLKVVLAEKEKTVTWLSEQMAQQHRHHLKMDDKQSTTIHGTTI